MTRPLPAPTWPRLGAFLALLSLLLVAPARAGDAPVDRARALFDAGARAYEAGQFLAAVQAFEASHQLAPHPAILFSIGQALRRQYFVDQNGHHLAKAIAHYRRYVEAVPQGGRRGDAAAALAELEPIAARLGESRSAEPPPKPVTRLLVSTDAAGARASLNGRPLADMPLVAEVAPGKHRVKIVAPGYHDVERELIAVEGGLVAQDVVLRPRPARLTVIGAAGAELSVDGRLLGVLPTPAPVRVSPGRRVVSVARNGYRAFTREIVAGRDRDLRLEVGLEPTGQRVASWLLLGTAGGAMLAGGALAGLAFLRQGDAEELLAAADAGNLDPPRRNAYEEAVAARDAFRTAAIATAASGAALGLAGLALYALDRPTLSLPAPEPEERPRPAPRNPVEVGVFPCPVPGDACLTFVGRF